MRIFFCGIFSLLVLPTLSQVRKTSVVSSIREVTVFTSGARIERAANVPLGSGRTEITFTGLSNQLDQQSVQLNANENITLLSVQATRDFLTEKKTEEKEKKFLDSVSSFKDRLALDKKMMEVYKNEESMLIKNESIGGQAGVKTAELKEALDLHRQRLTEVYRKQLEIQKQIEQEEKSLAAFTEQLLEISRKKDSIQYMVTALVESKTAANVIFQLRYNVKDAGWYPVYDVRVKDISTPLIFLMNANVFQRSGETWKDVSLQLSTGSPNDNATPSPLEPWKLGFYDPFSSLQNQLQAGIASGRVINEQGEPVSGASVIIKGSYKGVVTDANGFFKFTDFPANSIMQISAVGYTTKESPLTPGYASFVLKASSQRLEEVVVTGYNLEGKVAGVSIQADKKIKEEKSIQTVNVATRYQPTTIVYKIEDKYTIETDGKTSTIGIKNFEVAAGYQYFTAPKTDPSSFLTARILNWHDYDLQSGEANLYFEGSFLGKTYIDLSNTDDTLSLSLGKDNGVKVTRKLIKEFSTKRFIGSNRTESRSYEITVRNTKKEAVHLILQDQFPVSITKEISISDSKASGADINEDTGIATWNIQLTPGEEKKITLSYSVKYPKDRRVMLE